MIAWKGLTERQKWSNNKPGQCPNREARAARAESSQHRFSASEACTVALNVFFSFYDNFENFDSWWAKALGWRGSTRRALCTDWMVSRLSCKTRSGKRQCLALDWL